MALSTVIWVGEARKWIPEVVERARKLRVNGGTMPMFLVHYIITTCCPKLFGNQWELCKFVSHFYIGSVLHTIQPIQVLDQQ